MDPLATLNQTGAPGFNLSVTSLTFGGPSLSNAASCRCGSASPGMMMPGAGISPFSQQFGQPGAVDPMTQTLLRTEMMMNQTLMQLMQLMVQLMANRGGQSAAGSGTSAISSASGGG